MNSFFDKNYIGKFVDLGCFHPTRDNNTFRFYKKNWTGINVDLNPITIELFNFFRSKDININCAISDKKTQKKMYFVDNLSPLNTLDQNHLKFLKKNFLFNSTVLKLIFNLFATKFAYSNSSFINFLNVLKYKFLIFCFLHAICVIKVESIPPLN